MKYFTFKGSQSELYDVLDDKTLSKNIKTTLMSNEYLIAGILIDSQTESYLMLKYGEHLATICKDRSPVMFKDYMPKGYKEIK